MVSTVLKADYGHLFPTLFSYFTVLLPTRIFRRIRRLPVLTTPSIGIWVVAPELYSRAS